MKGAEEGKFRRQQSMKCVVCKGNGERANLSITLQVKYNRGKTSGKNSQQVHTLQDTYDFTKTLMRHSLDQLRDIPLYEF